VYIHLSDTRRKNINSFPVSFLLLSYYSSVHPPTTSSIPFLSGVWMLKGDTAEAISGETPKAKRDHIPEFLMLAYI
jgi:hypothetical protein